jgi:hypothetical protein
VKCKRDGTKHGWAAFEVHCTTQFCHEAVAMGVRHGLVAAVGLWAAVAASADAADIYSYTVRHPTFGEIGTYTDRVERNGDQWRVDTTLHVAVTALGVVLHREEAHRTQLWRGGRLVSFHGVTTTNGDALEIRGEAKNGGFIVATPTGTAVAPADVVPSDPWQAGRASSAMMLSTKTGRLKPVHASGGEPTRLTVQGVELAVRHYAFSSDQRYEVWANAGGIPIMFRTVENDTPIDFELSRDRLMELAAAR